MGVIKETERRDGTGTGEGIVIVESGKKGNWNGNWETVRVKDKTVWGKGKMVMLKSEDVKESGWVWRGIEASKKRIRRNKNKG